jgi:hypothetical protein
MITTHGHIVLADKTNVELPTLNEYEDAHNPAGGQTVVPVSPGLQVTNGSCYPFLVAEFLQARQRPSSCSLRMVELLGRDGFN